jgi:hypothetical protein
MEVKNVIQRDMIAPASLLAVHGSNSMTRCVRAEAFVPIAQEMIAL